jgi:rare lipoprotein A
MRDSPLRLAFAAVLLAAGCASDPAPTPQRQAKPETLPVSQLLKRPGGFYNDDAPDGPLPVNLDALPELTPRVEAFNSRANETYTVFGKEYVPYKALVEYRRQGTISWYGRKFHGQRTWSGEVYDMYAMMAAHPTLPIPSYARVTNLENQRSVIVRINDRGPFHSGRVMDVSYAAAYKLGFAQSGAATAEVEAILFKSTAPTPVAPPEAPEAAASLQASTDLHGIFLQLGAFGSSSNAESFRDKVQPQLSEVQLSAHSVLRDKLHRVQVGPFKTRAEANQTAEKLRELLGIRPVLVVR